MICLVDTTKISPLKLTERAHSNRGNTAVDYFCQVYSERTTHKRGEEEACEQIQSQRMKTIATGICILVY